MSKNIFFSVIIPTFNREKKIKFAIDSVIKQNYQNWELIIVDNNSTDNTKDLVNSYNNNKILFYEINNEGVIAKSRNYGIKKSKGDYLCFLDSDDWWHPDKLENVKKACEKGKNFIYHDHYVYSPNRLIRHRKIYTHTLQNPVFENLLHLGQSFATSSVTVKKTIFEKIDFFDEDKKYIAWEDFDAWIRISNITNSFYKIDKALSYINIDNTNLLNDELKIKNMMLFLQKYLYNKKLIPNWCLYNLLVAYYNVSNYYEVNEMLKKINFLNLSFFQKLNYIKIKLKCILM